uniref:CCHC-type domain-containing protein n=1 Tax=Loa loa TaxID=7209 RepID=A0A1I7VFT9_LOALO
MRKYRGARPLAGGTNENQPSGSRITTHAVLEEGRLLWPQSSSPSQTIVKGSQTQGNILKDHWDDECQVYQTAKQRMEHLKTIEACLNCLQKGHMANDCRKLKKLCFHCKGRHNSALCTNHRKDTRPEKVREEKLEPTVTNSTVAEQMRPEDGAQELESGFLLLRTKLGPMLARNGHTNSIRKVSVASVNSVVSWVASATSHEDIDHFWKLELMGIQDQPNENNDEQNIPRRYNETIQGQLQSGIIEEVHSDMDQEGIIHYLPHHEVIPPHKPITKLRIVHDASAHLKGTKSLNEVLYRGSIMLPDLAGILLRFRMMKNEEYVDNVILSANGTREAINKYPEVKDIFKKVAKNIREFLSNDQNFNKTIPKQDRIEGGATKILGITWINDKDTIRVTLKRWIEHEITKRRVLQFVA